MPIIPVQTKTIAGVQQNFSFIYCGDTLSNASRHSIFFPYIKPAFYISIKVITACTYSNFYVGYYMLYKESYISQIISNKVVFVIGTIDVVPSGNYGSNYLYFAHTPDNTTGELLITVSVSI